MVPKKTPIMENQMEKKMEKELEAGIISHKLGCPSAKSLK